MTSGNNKINAAVAFIVIVVIIWLIYDREQKKSEIENLKNDINERDDIDKKIKVRLQELIESNKDVDPKIATEVTQILALLEIKQDTTAVLKLAKVIENLLIELYQNDLELKELSKSNGRKVPVFADYLEFAKIRGVLSKEDYHLISVLKIIRNEEAHDLAIEKEKSRIVAAFLSGIALILSLCELLKMKKIPIPREDVGVSGVN